MFVIAWNNPTDRKSSHKMGADYHMELRDAIRSRNRIQFKLEDSLEEARTLLTEARLQHEIPGNHKKFQANDTYHLLWPQRSSPGIEPLRLGELVAVRAHGLWETVEIRGRSIEGDSKNKWGYNYARKNWSESSGQALHRRLRLIPFLLIKLCNLLVTLHIHISSLLCSG